MKTFLILTAILFLTACKGDFIVEKRGEPREIQVRENCTMCDVCYHFDYNSSTYKTGYSCSCDGKRDARYRITPVFGHYEKEPNTKYNKEQRTRIWAGECR